MKKCKNDECNNKFEGKKIYCSLKCRNIYVNKHLRDYSKNSQSLSKEKEYYLNPKICLSCNSVLIYKKRINKYCSSSCFASVTNKGRVVTEETRKKQSISIKNTLLKKGFSNFLKKCNGCNNQIEVKKRKNFCSLDCKKQHQRRNMSEFKKYKRECIFKFNLSDYPEEFNFKLIEEFGWYKPVNRGNNLDGVSRDHVYSIRDGFDNNVDPALISHPSNCKLVLQRQNSSKYKRSDITIDELKERVKCWKLKYNE